MSELAIAAAIAGLSLLLTAWLFWRDDRRERQQADLDRLNAEYKALLEREGVL